MFTLGDLNGDDILDAYVAQDPQDTVHISTGIANGRVNYVTSEPSPSPRTDGFGGNTKMAEIDNDGDRDVGISPIDVDIENCGFSDDFALLRNNGSGVLSDPWPGNQDQNIHEDPFDFAFIDIDRDGSLDLFMGLCSGYRVFRQTNVPPSEVVPLSDVTVSHGFIVSGGLAEIGSSNNQYLVANSRFGFSSAEPNLLRIDVGAHTSLASPLSCDLTLEARLSQPGGTGKTMLRNWSNNVFQTKDQYSIGSTEAFHVVHGVDLANHVRGSDDRIEMRFNCAVMAVFSSGGFRASVDFVEIRAFSVAAP
jgi:hypothetical protein